MNAQNTLLLDAVYAPVSIIPWTRAITLLWLGKVEVVEEYDRVVHSPSIAVRLPAVVRLVRRIVRGRRRVRLSRQNIYLRDGGKCQYCRHKVSLEDCTFDHVVLACGECNRKKGARTPEEAGLKLRKQPKMPSDIPYIVFKLRHLSNVPNQWKDYLASVEYWTATLLPA
jgi:5-methylcytosine-specific restriction endonuclease McrA